MADEKRTGQNVRKKSRPLNYFYLDVANHGLLLHKKLHINRGADMITTWCYPLHKRIAYTYTDVRRRKRPAFNMSQVCQMIGRGRTTVETAITDGMINEPQWTYGLSNQEQKFKYMFSENDVLALHAYLSTVHRGRPRKDGLITPQSLPTVRELRAIMRNETILYVKQGDEFVPTWQAADF